MQLFRVITLLFISFSLIFGNFANAAMLCCAVKDQPAVQMQMNKAEMPCHKTVEKTEKKMQHDKSCANCKNCVSANVIIFTQPTHQVTFANIKHSIPVNSFSSVIPESIYSPPKQIS